MSRSTVLATVLLAGLLALVVLWVALPPSGGSRGTLTRDDAAGDGEARAPARPGELVGAPASREDVPPRWVDGDPVGTLRLALGTAALEGSVTGDGAPLAYAAVRIVLEPRSLRAVVRTAPDGTWRVEGLPAVALEVRAVREGWRGRTTATPPLAEGEVHRLPPIELTRAGDPNGAIRVRVLDAFDRPVPGAQVLATTMPWAAHLGGGPETFGVPDVISKTARTDAYGEASLDALPEETYDVVAVAPGFQVAAQPALLLGDGQRRLVVFRLQEGVRITGVLTDAAGKPLEGGWVAGMHASSYVMAPAVRTGPDGAFALGGLREGTYMLFAYHDDAGELTAANIPAPSAGHRLALPGAGVIDLRVVRPDGSPVGAYTVRPYTAEPFGYTYSPAIRVDDPDGRIRIPRPAGAWTLAVTAPDGDHTASTSEQVEIGETTEVEITLGDSASVSGVVTDADGNHVPGAEIFVRHGGFPTGPTWEQYARSDAQGAFTVHGLDAAPLKLHVTHADYADRVVEVDPAPDGQGREITVVLERGASVEGRIDRNGEPVAGEQVNLFEGMAWWDVRTTRTGEDGRYRFAAVAPGTYTVTAGVFEFGARGASRGGVVVGATGRVPVDLDLGGAAGPGAVAGTVTHAGAPVNGATVTVVDGRGWDRATTARTDANGAYRAEGLAAGPATVYVRSQDDMTVSTTVDIAADGTPARADLAFGAGSLSARLLSTDGSPVAGAWLQIERAGAVGEEWATRAGAISDVEGRFVVDGLEEGRYRVRVAGGTHASLLTDAYELRGGALDLGTFRLETGTTLQGRVTDDDGNPVEDAAITLRDASGRAIYTFSLVTTGSDGRYRMTGVAPGRYVVGFEASGYAPGATDVTVPPGGATADGRVVRGGSIEVLAVTADGAPLPGVRASLVDPRGEAVRRTLSFVNLEDPGVGRTDGNGRAVLSDLAAGVYRVQVSRSGYRAEDAPPEVRVSPGTRATVTVTLVPES